MAVQTDTAAPRIGAGTRIGTVRLTVRNLDNAARFYEHLLGLLPEERPDGRVRFGAAGGGRPLLELRGDTSAAQLNPRHTGLYHFAMLVPNRRALAVSLVRLAQARWPLQGASDHGTHEALYLADPEGNGIEIACDRHISVWPRDPDGQVALRGGPMPLDVQDLLGELDSAPPDPVADRTVPPGTRIGHVHLQVSEVQQTEAFYHGLLGFDVVLRNPPMVLFVSAGGYHHHIGLNTWHSGGFGTPPPGAVGLDSYDILFETQREVDDVVERARAAGLTVEPFADGGSFSVEDPSANTIVLTA
jgi:catechol 2,3-dioxygenase